MVELLDGGEVLEAFFGKVDGGEVALDADGLQHFLEQECHVLAVATTLLERHFGGLRDKAVTAEADIAVADVVAHKADYRLHGLVTEPAASNFESSLHRRRSIPACR